MTLPVPHLHISALDSYGSCSCFKTKSISENVSSYHIFSGLFLIEYLILKPFYQITLLCLPLLLILLNLSLIIIEMIITFEYHTFSMAKQFVTISFNIFKLLY